MPAQMLDSPLAEADLSVRTSDYFGAGFNEIDNLGGYPFQPRDGDLTRHSYVFQAIYVRGDDYGGIQLRARIHTYGDLGETLRQWLETIAHRAAFFFDSGIETSYYGPAVAGTRGTAEGDGYLTGFNAAERAGTEYSNWEHEPIGQAEIPHDIGVIDWSTEVYVDEDFDDAYLSGIAQGLAYPYEMNRTVKGGKPPVQVPSSIKWQFEYEADNWEDYYARPPGHTDAATRYRKGGAGAGKDVYINDKKVGSLGPRARVRVNPEYHYGDGLEWQGNWSREGLVQETGATYQALRRGGVLYQVGETEQAVYLVTAREKPDGWREGDPDDVPIDLEVRDGEPGREINLLQLPRLETPIPIECRRDEKIQTHLGASSPRYEHELDGSQHWPRGVAYGV